MALRRVRAWSCSLYTDLPAHSKTRSSDFSSLVDGHYSSRDDDPTLSKSSSRNKRRRLRRPRSMKNEHSEIEKLAAQLLSLKDKVAVVTGAASGIGRGISLRLAEVGASVALLDIDEIKGRATAGEIEATGGSTSFLKCDVRSAVECQRAVDT